MRSSRKLDTEPPPRIKAAICSMIKTPLEDIEATFSRFTWDYDKGNFHHWTELFQHFDEIFRNRVCSRKDLQLCNCCLNGDDPFPKGAVLQILRVMRIILENCPNKSSFNGLEFTQLLSLTDPHILLAALQTLVALVRIDPSKLHVGGKLPGCAVLNHHLLSLSQGWGSKEEGLGVFSCAIDNGCDDLASQLGSTLHFEFYSDGSVDSGENGECLRESGLQVIHIPDLYLRSESDTVLLKQFVDQYRIPTELRFSLLTRIRYARAFPSLISRRQYVCIQLLAFMVLVQSSDVQKELVVFFANDPEFINEVIKVVQSEEIVPENIRTLAMLALGAQLAAHSVSHERARILNVSTINTGWNRLLLLSLLQKSVLSLTSHTESCSVSFVEALLHFFLAHVISSPTSGSAIRETGLVPTLLPLLQDADSSHMHLVVFAVNILQKFMEYNNSAVTLFRDLGGLDDMISRLQIEVTKVVEASEEGKAAMLGDDLSSLEDQIPYCRRRLIKALLKALGLTTYAQANSMGPQGSEETALLASLSLIFHHAKRFGGDIFFSGVTLMNEIIHKDPACFSNLHAAGLPIAFLDAVAYGLLPSSKALHCIPSGLDALCLNSIGLQLVKDQNALQFLVAVFTSRRYSLALNEGVGPLAYAMEELLRHVPSLRGPCVDVLIEILEKVASMGGTNLANLEGLDGPVPMDTDLEDKHNGGQDVTVQASGLVVDGMSNERFILLCIFHVTALMHRAMENVETCRLFVEKNGIEVLMRFLTLPDIPHSSEGMSHFVHIIAVFKAFSQQHSASLAQALCRCLRYHLKITFSQLNSVPGASLLALENGKKRRVFQCLFIIQIFMFIADGLRENRWMTALMTEFGNDSKGVLHDIGKIHREVLWQVTLFEDSKSEIEKDDGGGSFCGFPRNSDATTSDVDVHSSSSVGQYVNPILRQRRQSSGWNSEPQLFDLIQLYHNFGHHTHPQWMLNADSSSRVRLGIGQRDQVPQTHRGDSANQTASNKQKSFHLDCFEILKSLSGHISHLFLELGKVMLLPSWRRDDSVTVVPVVKTVASILACIILDDLNYDGQIEGAQMESQISMKCCYMGKVVDFIKCIIVDRQECCNPVLVNFFYVHGVIKSILTTFEATCQLLWTIMQPPVSLMEIENSKSIPDHNDENDNAWIFGTLGSYAWLMDHLVTSACIIAPSTTHLLVQPVSTGIVLTPSEPENFLKLLQSQVLKVVLPVWNHPSFFNCSVGFIASICSIMMHVYSGVDIKLAKVTGGIGGAQLIGPSPDDSVIGMIVEMGFSRSRAGEALRRVGANSVEMAMEWLFSHPEEVSEENDELARALALSLGDTDVSVKDDMITNVKDTEQEEEEIQVPPSDEILSTCIKLLQAKESVAFAVRDLLVTICTHNEGQHRFKVISSLIEQLELSRLRSNSVQSRLSSLSHILALILHEDSTSCEVAAAQDVVSIALDILSDFVPTSVKAENLSVPKWVTATLLALDCMLQRKPKFDFHSISDAGAKRKDVGSGGNSVIVSEENQHISLESTWDMGAGCMTIAEKKRVTDIACNLIQNQLASNTVHAVLQLCARLTKVHAIAVHFLEAGGLVSLLRLPASCLFSGFDSVAATIIHHILEDPHTLQQAMEMEIRQNLVSSLNRHPNGRVYPLIFLTTLAPVISRDPAVFMLAAKAVCQVEMVEGRAHVILLKDKAKDREKEKHKEKEKIAEKDRSAIGDNKHIWGETSPVGNSGNGTSKMSDLNAKNVKVHKRLPQSFLSTIEHLLDAIIQFSPSLKEDDVMVRIASPSSVTDMDVDEVAPEEKGKAVMNKLNLGMTDMPEASAAPMKVIFILKLMTEIFLMYPASINVLLRLDIESSHCRGSPQGGSSAVGHGGPLYHVLHKLLPYPGDCKKEGKIDGDWRQELTNKASQFLMAICVRAAEGRRRLFSEITNALNSFVDSSDTNGFRPPECKMYSFIDLINGVLAGRSPSGPNILAEVAMTCIDVGMVQALTRALQILDLDRTDSLKVVNGIVKALESLTREQAHAHCKDGAPRDCGSNQDQGRNEGNHCEGSPNPETIIECHRCEIVSDQLDSFNSGQFSGGSDGVTDDMEHDRDVTSGSFVPEAEEDFMHEASEEVGDLEDGGTSSGMTFNVQHDALDILIDEAEEEVPLSEDGRENVEEEDEDDLDADEIQHLSHPDTDLDDYDDLDFDEDDLDEDLLEEEEEEEEDDDDDDEDDENRLILRLEDGVNVLDRFEVLGGANAHYPNDLFHVMPVGVFGLTHRQGRTTSIYNLLGRTDGGGTTFQHPLFTGPPAPLQSIFDRTTEASERVFVERNLESILTTSSLDSMFRTRRSGRPGNHLSSWADDNQQHRGDNGAAIAEAIEQLFISQLQIPVSNQPSDLPLNDTQSEANDEASVLQAQEHGVQMEASIVNLGSGTCETIECAPSHNEGPNASSTCVVAAEASQWDAVQERQTASASPHGLSMQYECNEPSMLVVEALSQDNTGSGPTLGESHRSMEVEIGSSDGHDDVERQNSTRSLPVADTHSTRIQALHMGLGTMGNHGQTDNRDLVQQNASAVVDDENQTAHGGGINDPQQNNMVTGSSSIDPAFLEALPEELRAEILSSQQIQVAQMANGQPPPSGDIDPEFLAALPLDIQEEVLAQQRAQRLHESQELEGQPVEMDSASIIATFPSDLREEVLLTSSDAILANLTPALVAEANMLRERFARRYRGRALRGVFHRNRRNDSGIGTRAISSGNLTVIRSIGVCKSAVGGKLIEADRMPLVDTAALKAMVQLLYLVQPLYKGPLQRLLLNLCAHSVTRATLMQILLNMLMHNVKGSHGSCSSCVWDSSYRLYGCHGHVIYSRPQLSDGVPPLVSRRVLETLTYLARNDHRVANMLLYFELSVSHPPESLTLDSGRGKEVMVDKECQLETAKEGSKEGISIMLLLNLLNQPLYSRSIVLLEEVMNLLDVIMANAEIDSKSSTWTRASGAGPATATHGIMQDAQLHNDISGSGSDLAPGNSAEGVELSNPEENPKPSTSDTKNIVDAATVLLSLPKNQLRLLCSLLARDGLSDNAYSHVAEVLKKLATVAPPHCHLFISELADAAQRLSRSALSELQRYGEAETICLSPTSIAGTAILRVLQSLSSLAVLFDDKDEDDGILSGQVHDDVMDLFAHLNATLEPLWQELSLCITKIESFLSASSILSTESGLSISGAAGIMSPLSPGTQNILPYVEAFFVTCEKLQSGQPTSGQQEFNGITACEVKEAASFSGSTSLLRSYVHQRKVDEKGITFIKFAERHRVLLNAFVHQNPDLLEKSFSPMLKFPRLIDFDNKRAYFRSRVRHRHDHRHSPLRISVRRAYILEDSYNQLRMRSTSDLKGRLTVHFQGEEGIDAGGLTREWYQLLSRVIFDKGALLFTTVGNESTFQPNPNSVYQTEHLSYFKFAGQVVAKALFDGQLLDVHFTRSFYKHILGIKVTYHDIEATDPDFFKNLKWMLENDISEILDLTFSMDADEEKLILYERAEVTDYELIPGGRNLKVSEENKHEYVDLVAEHRLTTAIRPQINAFLEGFCELAPRDLISIFNDKELELLISGLPEIDLDDLRANTEYAGYSAASSVIQWFWEVVQGFGKEDTACLLQFVTGTSKVPLEGFKALQGISGPQRFQVHKAYGSPNHLPSAHTCFNQLDLPEYPSKQRLQERLLLAIHEATEGFGFG